MATDYFAIAEELKTETDETRRAELLAQLYVFENSVPQEVRDLFDYFAAGYIQDNPGEIDGTFTSYVGKHYSSTGEIG